MARIARWMLPIALLACAPPEGAGPVEGQGGEETPEVAVVADIGERLARFAATELVADLSGLSSGDEEVLARLVAASRPLDEIFLRQVWAANPDLRERLRGAGGPRIADGLAYYRINFGPWDRLAEMEPFIGEMPHPPGAGYYPADMSKGEFEAWIAEHPEDREALTSLTTVVRRQGERLVAVPYSRQYREWLESSARELRAAAALTEDASLRRFLELRAEAFFTGDYYASDLAWMDLDSPVEVTIGPYETYEDSLFGYKAAFESFVTVALAGESAALARYKEELPWLERNLPIPDRYKNMERGTESPIRVVDVLFTAGDAKAGVQTLAFNLPNDERVREAKGSKKVLLRNVMRAKYEQILVPIAERVLAREDAERVSFEAYFNEILHHELAHGLGPGRIRIDGRQTEVRLELKDLYSTLEEAKADVMGVYNILALIDRGLMPEELRGTLEATYLAGLFRAARFGIHEAHGRGVVSQFNYLMGEGAVELDPGRGFRTVPEAFPAAVRDLLREMLMLQATGDYEGTAEFLEAYGKPSSSLLGALARLDGVAVDIRPIYPQADSLAGERPGAAPASG